MMQLLQFYVIPSGSEVLHSLSLNYRKIPPMDMDPKTAQVRVPTALPREIPAGIALFLPTVQGQYLLKQNTTVAVTKLDYLSRQVLGTQRTRPMRCLYSHS